MAKFNSRVSVFKFDTTGDSLTDVSAYLTEISGLPGERELIESTTIGDAGREREPNLENGMIRLAGFYDDTATTGPDEIFGTQLTHTSAMNFEYYPDATQKYSGTAWVRRYEITTRVGEMVGFTVELEVNGQVTRA